ncbi:MAG: hypothetical protein GC145_10305 [Caulobacter sp.]|nr:hypothetical protein [Caulobacter sp.]
MPYREKTAWLSLAAMVLTYGPFFALIAAGLFRDAPLPNLKLLALFAATTLTQLAILGAGHLVLRLRSPEDARTPPDEREQAIILRARNLAYFALMTGVILVGIIQPFYAAGWSIVSGSILSIIIAELIGYGAMVVSYRRQA